MRIFVRVVERGSMSAAARDLGIGQPAVSERIERLEKHLGVRLLLRHTRALTCTDAGATFYEHSKQALEIADLARASVARDKDEVRGTLRIAAPHCLGEVVVPGVLSRIREQHPALQIDLILNDRIVDPTTEGVDISLRLGDHNAGRFVSHRLGQVRRELVAAPSYLARHGRIEHPDELIRHPFIHVSYLFTDQRLRLLSPQRLMANAAISPSVTVSHWRPMYELLLAGNGIGVVQLPACARDLAEGRLMRLLPDYIVPEFELNALTPALNPVPHRTRAIITKLGRYMPEALKQYEALAPHA